MTLDCNYIDSKALEFLAKVIVQARQLKIPLLVPASLHVDTTRPEGLLPYSANEIQSLAEKMMLIYKDENLRSQLIKSASSLPACLSLQAHPFYHEYLHHTY